MSRYLQVAVQYVTVSTDRGAVCHGHYCTGCGAVCHGVYKYWNSKPWSLQILVQYVTFSTGSGAVCHGMQRVQ